MKRDPLHRVLDVLAYAFAASCWSLVLVRITQHFLPV